MTTKTKTAINVQAATKVADQIISRLFDHRQFTSGEIRYLIDQLDGQCKVGESLEKAINQNQEAIIVSDMSANEVSKINSNELGHIESQVSKLLSKADQLLEIEKIQKEKCDRLLEKQRTERAQIMSKCQSETEDSIKKIDDSIRKKEDELEARYINFEKKLEG